jgi:hypothetical protein
LPFKLYQDRCHHIPRLQDRVTNWPAYEAGLRQRGSLTIWFTDEAVAAWAAPPRTTQGGPVIGDGLRSRIDERRVIEVKVAVGVLNRMLELGRPNCVRVI